jgi:gluconokinase
VVQAGQDSNERRAIVVMGVSGSGKSTLAALLAERLDCPLIEGDAFHSAANVAKMAAGHPLDDTDRWPWLDRVGQAVGAASAGAGIAVAACSALKHRYRERLQAASDVPLLFVLLDTRHDEIARRLEQRAGHYMPASLLDSQLATLERPGADERALTLDAAQTPDVLCAAVLAWIGEPATR